MKLAPVPPRSAAALKAVLDSLDVEHEHRYRPGYLVSNSTWCNRFVTDATEKLGCPVPFVLANEQHDWISGDAGRAKGWRAVDFSEALKGINEGLPTVAAWRNPIGHGHVGMGCPSSMPGLHIAAAGRVNFACAPIAWSFGDHPFRLFSHQ